MERNARPGWKPIPMPKTCAHGCLKGQSSSTQKNDQKRDQAGSIFFYPVFEHVSATTVG